MCGFGFRDVFCILGRVLDLEVFLDSGTCFVSTNHRTLAKLSLYFCRENFGLFSKTCSAAWLATACIPDIGARCFINSRSMERKHRLSNNS